MSIGISKRELLGEYYWDELLVLFDEYNVLQQPGDDDVTEEVSPVDFLGDGGEWMSLP